MYFDQETYRIIFHGNYLQSKHLEVTTDTFYHILWYIFNVLVDFYIPFHLCLGPHNFFFSSYFSTSKHAYENKIFKNICFWEVNFKQLYALRCYILTTVLKQTTTTTKKRGGEGEIPHKNNAKL